MSTITTDFQPLLTAESIELGEMYRRLERLEKAKLDMVAQAQSLFAKGGNLYVVREGQPRLEVNMTKLALDQLCAKLGIPPQYAHRMLADRPELLDANLNSWLEREFSDEGKDRKFLLRTYTEDGNHGTLRGVLSDRYFDISSFQLLTTLLAVVADLQNETGYQIKALAGDMSEQNIQVRFYVPELEQVSRAVEFFKDAPTGSRHKGFFTGVVFRNSEVGKGMYMIAPRIITGACMNGNVYATDAIKRQHIGGQLEQGNVVWSETTIRTELQLVMDQTRDAFKQWLSPDYLGKRVEEMEALADMKLAYPMDTVVNLAQDLSLSKATTQAALSYLAGCGMGDTMFGAMQAMTGVAKDLPAEDRFRIEQFVTTELVQGADPKKFDHRNRTALKFVNSPN